MKNSELNWEVRGDRGKLKVSKKELEMVWIRLVAGRTEGGYEFKRHIVRKTIMF